MTLPRSGSRTKSFFILPRFCFAYSSNLSRNCVFERWCSCAITVKIGNQHSKQCVNIGAIYNLLICRVESELEALPRKQLHHSWISSMSQHCVRSTFCSYRHKTEVLVTSTVDSKPTMGSAYDAYSVQLQQLNWYRAVFTAKCERKRTVPISSAPFNKNNINYNSHSDWL